MAVIHSWDTVGRDDWTFTEEEKDTSLLIFVLKKLPDFSEPRFSYLSEKVDERQSEIVKKQLQTLRQLHSIGNDNDIAISLRIVKEEGRLLLFIICRLSKKGPVNSTETEIIRKRILASFPQEYEIEYLEPAKSEDISIAIDNSWIHQCIEIFKKEDKYNANIEPYFYSTSLWSSDSNDMSMVCRTMLRTEQKVAIDITLIPTNFISDERDWVDNVISRLREAQAGERIIGEKNKLLQQFPQMPVLKIPAENFENLIKRYDSSRLFISSIKVFSSGDPSEVAGSLISEATKTKAQTRKFDSNCDQLELLKNGYANIDIQPEFHTVFWDHENRERPFRAQRLHRLVDLEEIANFWRIPIPIINGFPGFELDTGLGNKSLRKYAKENITLGTYCDDPANNDIAAEFPRQQLMKHGLIVGVPGSGKTTAMFNIIHQLWNNEEKSNQIPFIVLEPAKTEFRALKKIDGFKKDLLVFTLGDERISPFRFNPFEVLPGIPLESHISRLNACFVGAFDLFDPLPLLLDNAIRQTYYSKGWFDDSVGGENGVDTPTLSDLCNVADRVIQKSGYSDKLKDDFNASLLQRLNSLRRGSKGRMLDTRQSIPAEVIMNIPIILELDALNEDEKALMMMFLLSFVYEYCKIERKSGSSLKHMLFVEEAHNLIGANIQYSEYRANPKEHTISLFIKMLAEMRALGEGIFIADQLPTAIAPQAVKQTNIKILMRITAKDDREVIGNTMDLSESEMKKVVHFKTGHSYIYHEDLDRVRMVRMTNFKEKFFIEEPQNDEDLRKSMEFFEKSNPNIYFPYSECASICKICNRRVSSQAANFVDHFLLGTDINSYNGYIQSREKGVTDRVPFTGIFSILTQIECLRIAEKYGDVNPVFPSCAYVHLLHTDNQLLQKYNKANKECNCNSTKNKFSLYFSEMLLGA